MLVDHNGKFVTQRTHPPLKDITAQFSGDELQLTHPQKNVCLSVEMFSVPKNTVVWGDQVNALGLGNNDDANAFKAWLEQYLEKEVDLVFMPEDTFRQVDTAFFSDEQRVSFADGFPILLTNTASLDELNSRLDQAVPMSRFRPNIVVSGNEAYEEDSWQRIRIGEIEFAVVKPCSRCVMTTINDSGEKTKEPLKTLSTYRKNEFGVCFGQNLVPLQQGTIKRGDTVTVIETK